MSCCAGAIAAGPARFDPSTRAKIEEERLRAASRELAEGLWLTRFIVPDMHCIACVRKIERALSDLAHVRHVRANLSLREVAVRWDANAGGGTQIMERLSGTGFSFHFAEQETVADEEQARERGLLLALAVAGFAAANIMLLSVSVWSGADAETAQLFHLISGLIAVPAVAIAGRPFFSSAIRALSAGGLNMDVPISLAVLLALAMSLHSSLTGGEEAYFDASVTLLFFLLIGRYLDQLMRNRARGASERLASISSKGGLVLQPDGEVVHVGINQIVPGMILRVLPGDRLPVDGVVITGSSTVDSSHVTGESDALATTAGDPLQAGALNLSSPLDIRATSDAEKSFLGEMQRMMQAAENGRSRYVRVADRMARIYAPAVHLLALLTFIWWMVSTGGDWYASLYTAIAVLIITCPCALGLAVPVAHVIGAKRLMEEGILMRDGTALERLAEADMAVFDKTGTLSDGTSVQRIGGPLSAKRETLIRALASNSSHPVAHAVAERLSSGPRAEVETVIEHPGLGVEGLCKGRKIRLGRPEWALEIADCPDQSISDASCVFVIEGQAATGFRTEESLRAGAAEAVHLLGEMGLDTAMLSGDRTAKVTTLASEIGMRNVHAEQSPADKIAFIESRKGEGRSVLMVGDGINDAPALAAGSVSMAPASASDAGRMASDFIFTRPSLGAVPLAITIARETGKIVRQNFGLAIAYNCIAVPLAMAGYVTPLFAAIAMSASSIVVVGNSLRINLVGKDKPAEPAELRSRAGQASHAGEVVA